MMQQWTAAMYALKRQCVPRKWTLGDHTAMLLMGNYASFCTQNSLTQLGHPCGKPWVDFSIQITLSRKLPEIKRSKKKVESLAKL